MKSKRIQQALNNGLWAFAVVLIAASLWGFWHALIPLQNTLQQAATVQQRLYQLESVQVQMERCLLGLAHADSQKARYVGYDPAQLYAELRRAYDDANTTVRDILATQSGIPDLDFQQQLIRLELEWAQIRSRLAEYITADRPQQISLTTLRTFSFRGQDTLDAALRDFKGAFQVRLEREVQQNLQVMAGYSIGLLVALGIIIGQMWHRWARPARWIQRALTQPCREDNAPRPLRGTEWEEIYQRITFQERRLREVEVFMRDLAMGRIPEPLQPTDPADSLARSSAWLIKRIEELRPERREAV